jgi:hypothetical protein
MIIIIIYLIKLLSIYLLGELHLFKIVGAVRLSQGNGITLLLISTALPMYYVRVSRNAFQLNKQYKEFLPLQPFISKVISN